MKQEYGKYYLHFAWLPKVLSNGDSIWLTNYHEAYLNLPILDLVYTIRRISPADYIIETLRGDIVDGHDMRPIESMLNAAYSDFQS
jgi:hypothetical protein